MDFNAINPRRRKNPNAAWKADVGDPDTAMAPSFGGPSSVLFLQHSGSTVSAFVHLYGAGQTAVALGVVLGTDFGDAPGSYGEAGSVLQPTWSGGGIGADITKTSDATAGGGDSYNLSAAAEADNKAISGEPEPRLGTTVDSDGGDQYSDDATGDGDDEDGLPNDNGLVSGGYSADGKTYTQTVSCTTDGTGAYVRGWIDWNQNGEFADSSGTVDTDEESNASQCSGVTATLKWTVPIGSSVGDAVATGHPSRMFMRVRIVTKSAYENGELAPAGVTTDGGEVEDYTLNLTKLKLTKTVDNTNGGTLKPSDWTLAAASASDDPAKYEFTQNDPSDSSTNSTLTGTSSYVLAAPGSYDLSESPNDTTKGSGYEQAGLSCSDENDSSSVAVDENDKVTVVDGAAVTCTFTNASQSGTISWDKADSASTGTKLSGSTWELQYSSSGDSGTYSTVSGTDGITDCTSDSCTTGDYDDSDSIPGAFRLIGLRWGHYKLTEKTAPAGYVKDGTTYGFTISGESLTPTLTVDGGTTSTTSIPNAKTSIPTLPLTGGIGTWVFRVIGSVFVLGALAVGLLLWKRSRTGVGFSLPHIHRPGDSGEGAAA